MGVLQAIKETRGEISRGASTEQFCGTECAAETAQFRAMESFQGLIDIRGVHPNSHDATVPLLSLLPFNGDPGAYIR